MLGLDVVSYCSKTRLKRPCFLFPGSSYSGTVNSGEMWVHEYWQKQINLFRSFKSFSTLIALLIVFLRQFIVLFTFCHVSWHISFDNVNYNYLFLPLCSGVMSELSVSRSDVVMTIGSVVMSELSMSCTDDCSDDNLNLILSQWIYCSFAVSLLTSHINH